MSALKGRRLRTTHDVSVPLQRAALWVDVVDAARYEHWWPWLRVSGADELVEGARLHVSIPSPLGYRIDITLTPRRVVPEARLEVGVTGDLEGTGVVVLHDEGQRGTRVELTWDVRVVRRLLRGLATVAAPLLDWGHRRVVRRAVDDFLRRRGADRQGHSPSDLSGDGSRTDHGREGSGGSG